MNKQKIGHLCLTMLQARATKVGIEGKVGPVRKSVCTVLSPFEN